MSAIDCRQIDERASLERIALFAREQLIHAINDLLVNFIGAAALKQAVEREAPPTREGFESANRRFRDVAEALMLWHSDDDYVSADGLPRPMPTAGKRSLTTLAKRVVDSTEGSRALVSDLLEFGLVEEIHGLFRPPRRSAVLGKANVLNLAYATITATRLLRTISHNVSSGSPPLYERQVSEVTISATDLPLYLRFVEQQAQYLIDSVDDWLLRRRVSGATRRDKIKVGIGAFAWADLAAKPASKARRAKHGGK
jgi:hypothetical protein